MMLRVMASIALVIALALWHGEALVAVQGKGKPLPIVTRQKAQSRDPFDLPPLIVEGRVREIRTIQILDQRFVGGPTPPPGATDRAYRMDLLIVRVNERLASDPDLSGRKDFLLVETPGRHLNLGFDKDCVVFIKFAKSVAGYTWRDFSPDPPPYAIAVPDGGFEIVGLKDIKSATVRVLRPGGPLAPYDGKPFDEVFRLMTGQTFLDWDPTYRVRH